MSAEDEADHVVPPEVAALVGRLAREHRSRAFDNVDLDRVLGCDRLAKADARWIGLRLMRAGRSLETYSAGRGILARLEA